VKTIGLMVLGGTAITLPVLLTEPYYLHILILVCVNAILGMSFALIYSVGLITLGAAAYYGIGAYTSTLLVTKCGLSFWLALPCAVIITGIVATVIGFLIVRYSGISFVAFTLISSFVIQRLWGSLDFFGGWGGIINIPPPTPILSGIDFSNKTHYYYLALGLLVITTLVLYGLYGSRVGRTWRAIKLDPRLAMATGIDPFPYRLGAFVLASASAGMAGAFYAHYAGSIMPDTFSLLKSIHIQLYAILGGLDYYILGPFIGSIILTVVPEMLQIKPQIEPYFTAALLIILVMFLRPGVVGFVYQLVEGLKKIPCKET